MFIPCKFHYFHFWSSASALELPQFCTKPLISSPHNSMSSRLPYPWPHTHIDVRHWHQSISGFGVVSNISITPIQLSEAVSSCARGIRAGCKGEERPAYVMWYAARGSTAYMASNWQPTKPPNIPLIRRGFIILIWYWREIFSLCNILRKKKYGDEAS